MTICFGENVKALRIKNELTQEKLADFLGISFQSVSKWERGESYPDITMLPIIASLFNVSVDDLLGINEFKKQNEIEKFIDDFDRLFLVDTPKSFELIKNAVKEYPNDYRLLVRQMSALHSQCENFGDVTGELENINDKIQCNCTDDSIRIKAKRILINHYRCRQNTEYDKKAAKISEDLPSVNDCKEYVSTYVFRPFGNGADPFYTGDEKHRNACSEAIAAALTMLENSVCNYCLYDDSFSLSDKISALEKSVSILKSFYSDGYYAEQWLTLVYFYGDLSWLNFLCGDDSKAIEYLDFCADEAIRLDNAADEHISASFFFKGKTLKKPKRGKTCCERIKLYALNQYPFSSDFRNKEEFKQIISKLSR